MGKSRKNAPVPDEWDHPYVNVDAPAWLAPDGTFSSGTEYLDQLKYAPYGKGNMGFYWREIIANVVLKEGLAVLFVSFLLPAIVSTAPGPDPVSRAIFVGLVAGLSIIVMLKWGYNDRVPRHLTAGATVSQFIVEGQINWFLALVYLAVGFAFATCGAAVLYTTGTSAIPIIGTPNNQWAGTTFLIQFLFTIVIALTVMDQFTTRKGKPRVFKQRDVPAASDIAPNRPYQEDIGARPLVYGIIVWLLVTVGYLKWGLWSFNSYTYFAGALGLQFLGCGGSWNNVNCLTSVGTNVSGAAALFILTDVAAWCVAALLNAVLYWMHNNEPRMEDDDSSYGHSYSKSMSQADSDDYQQQAAAPRRGNVIQSEVKERRRKRVTVNESEPIQSRLNLDPDTWAGKTK